jgi:hypothetical protein
MELRGALVRHAPPVDIERLTQPAFSARPVEYMTEPRSRPRPPSAGLDTDRDDESCLAERGREVQRAALAPASISPSIRRIGRSPSSRTALGTPAS